MDLRSWSESKQFDTDIDQMSWYSSKQFDTDID